MEMKVLMGIHLRIHMKLELMPLKWGCFLAFGQADYYLPFTFEDVQSCDFILQVHE